MTKLPSSDLAKSIYASLVRCRKFDEKIVELYPEQEMRCPTHLSLGQEGAAVGICRALRKDDLIFSTHRCHSHAVAKGGDFKILFAELYGKEAGCCRGKGGSMHFVQPDIGLMGSSAIVGGNLPLAMGAALAAKMQGKDTVSVSFFGDGAVEQGTFHEGLSFSSLKKLPVIFACENNGLATCTPISSRQPYSDLYKRAEGYHIPGVQVNGRNVLEVYEAAQDAVARARKGDGPTLIEMKCCRWKEHVGPNFDYNLGFRSKEEVEKEMGSCPVNNFRKLILENNILKENELKEISGNIDKEINEAVKFAKETPFPKPEEIYEDI